MLYKTKGVVFRFTRFGESSLIVTVFTEHHGLQSYMVNGVRSKTSRNKIALFQPLTLLELVVYHRENANINRIKELKCLHPYQTLHNDIIKSTIAMFISEVVNKAVKEESHTQNLCHFLISSLITLDTMSHHVENFHVLFLMKLSRFLGFGTNNAEEMLGWRVTDPLIETLIGECLRAEYTTPLSIKGNQRREILDLVLKFYYEHTGMSGEIKSLHVLREILK